MIKLDVLKNKKINFWGRGTPESARESGYDNQRWEWDDGNWRRKLESVAVTLESPFAGHASVLSLSKTA